MKTTNKWSSEGIPIELLIDITLLIILVLTSIFIARSKDLLAVVMLFSIYGLVSASLFMLMDAVDVAFTEAAVGAGISPLLMLVTLTIVGRFQKGDQISLPSPFTAFILVSITGILLVVGTLDMPAFGAADSPAQEHVAPRYILQSGEEIGIPNIVTSILASYRAYDTLGEVVVIFTAGIGVLTLLGFTQATKQPNLIDEVAKREDHKLLRIVAKMLIPAILLFAFYVQFHGDFGPGGGFQAGAIFAAAIILYTMLFGVKVIRKVINKSFIRILAAIGVLIYGSIGIVSFASGSNYLDYHPLASSPQTAQHIGILVIELGVGITVASVMLLIFFSFSENTRKEQS